MVNKIIESGHFLRSLYAIPPIPIHDFYYLRVSECILYIIKTIFNVMAAGARRGRVPWIIIANCDSYSFVMYMICKKYRYYTSSHSFMHILLYF